MDKDLEDRDKKVFYRDFQEPVNMAPSSLKKWLNTDESKCVGWDSGDGEPVGHKSGCKIIDLLHKKKAEFEEADYKHMQK